MSNPTSKVEETLRGQRESWREISDRVARVSSRELPPEPPKRILLFGVGSSHYAARLAGYTLIRDKSRPRLPVQVAASTSVGTEIVPTKGDWAIALTHRGGNPCTNQAIEACERAGAFTIQVSAQGAKECEAARFHLPTCPLETVEPHTAAVTGAVCAVTSLLMGAKALEEWDALRSIGEPDIDLFRRRAGKGPTVLLGEWEGEWLAREGALKLIEMARLPVRAYSSEEFFHGPRFSVGKDDVIWHVGMPKDIRHDDIKAAHRIGVFGSTPLAWVPALVELQWLALAVAYNLGVDPDHP